MAESYGDAAVAITVEASVDGISQETQVVPHVIADGGEDLDQKWLESIKRKVADEPRKIKASFSSCSIYRIPLAYRHYDQKAYVPQILSIGPLHYERRTGDLQAMEEHKWRYLRSVLAKNGDDCLQQYLRDVKKLEKQARGCYSEEIKLDSNSFVEMLVLDACFIIELFCRTADKCDDDDDPILSLVLRITITTDLIMLENQIPYFILEHLFNLMKIRRPLVAMTLNFFSYWDTLRTMMTNGGIDHSNVHQFHHLLHILHSSFLPSIEIDCPKSDYSRVMPSACELEEAGIKFKKGIDSGFLCIKYHDGEIEIPPLQISPLTEPIFLNLVAFEQCHPKQRPYVTPYISFMDQLMNSAKDVRILSQKGIIIEKLGCTEEVATLFSKIGRDACIDDDSNYLGDVTERINQSAERLWPRFRAALMRDYFNSPWAFLSFLAAFTLLLLTFFQFFFSAFPKFALEN